MKKVLATALISLLGLNLALIAPARAAGGATAGVTPTPAPTIAAAPLTSASPTAAANCQSPNCVSVHYQHTGPTAATSYSCSLLVNSGKLSDGHHFNAQGFLYCDQQMSGVEETLTAYHCDKVLWGCVWSKKYTMESTPCVYYNSQGTWCPEAGSSISNYVPGGDGGWRVYFNTTVTPYDGAGSDAQAVGDPINF